MKNYVYMVRLAYSTDDCDGIDTYLYRDFNNALKKHLQLIKDECNPENSWVSQEVFNENGEINNGFTLEFNEYNGIEKDLYWTVIDNCNYNKHVFLDLIKLKVE